VKGKQLIQVFLSTKSTTHPGIFEVSKDGNKTLYCNCPGFVARNKCKHTDYVEGMMADNQGVYPLKLSPRATAKDAEESMKSDEAMRKFIIKFGKIEVL
jgi:hypothetical protein